MKKVFSYFVTVLAVVFMASQMSAASMSVQEANALFSRANASYRAQKYEEAAQAYKQLLSSGYSSAQVLYNAGTTAARLDKTGEALGYLMRAQQISPRDENIQANLTRIKLDHARKLGLGDEAVAALGEPNVWNRIVEFLTAEEWLAIIWVCFSLACLAAFIMIVMGNRTARAAGKVCIALGVTVLFIVIVPGAVQVYRTRIVQRAVALSSGEVLSGPADRFTRVAQLQEGQLVRNLGRHEDGYYRIRLDNGLQGYVNSKTLMEL